MHNSVEDFSIFSLFVRHAKNVLSDSDCNKIKQIVTDANFKSHSAFTGDAISTHGPDDDPIINQINQEFNINEILTKYINEYITFYGMKDIKLANVWVNIQKPGSILRFHTHPLSIVSGAFYINVDENSSPIFFNNPNPFSEFIEYYDEPLHPTAFNYKRFRITPSIGSLILFPSWLKHGSDILNQTDERIVLSFNTMYDYNNLEIK